MKIRRNKKGFTLIELLIVIAIIGILAAIAIPSYTGYVAKAKISGVVYTLGAVKNACLVYYTEAGAYPVAADAATIGSLFGVTPSTQYGLYSIAACVAGGSGAAATGGAITAQIQNVSSDTNGKTIVLTPTWATSGLATWAWSGSVPSAYLPKGG